MGSLGLREGDRRGYQANLEARMLELGMKAGRAELEEKWKKLRRGWYLGQERFLEKLEAWLDKAANGRLRESQSGPAREAHDEAAAERLAMKGAKALGFTMNELVRMPSSALEKVALAWWLRRQTTVSLRWTSERLSMGHYTRVTQAVSRMNRKHGRKLRQMRNTLLKLEHK